MTDSFIFFMINPLIISFQIAYNANIVNNKIPHINEKRWKYKKNHPLALFCRVEVQDIIEEGKKGQCGK